MTEEPQFSGENPPYKLVFKDVSCTDNIRYSGIVRARIGCYFSEPSIDDLVEKLNCFNSIPILNQPPDDWMFQQERLNKIFEERGLGKLPELTLMPLDDSELAALA